MMLRPAWPADCSESVDEAATPLMLIKPKPRKKGPVKKPPDRPAPLPD
jgi:hypothetical protein